MHRLPSVHVVRAASPAAASLQAASVLVIVAGPVAPEMNLTS